VAHSLFLCSQQDKNGFHIFKVLLREKKKKAKGKEENMQQRPHMILEA
jgi:hypothetical protein